MTITITWEWLNWISGAIWGVAVLQSVVMVAMRGIRDEPVLLTLCRLVNAMAFGGFLAGWRLIR